MMTDMRPKAVMLMLLAAGALHAQSDRVRPRAEIIPLRHQDAGQVAELLGRLRAMPERGPLQVAQASGRTPETRSDILRPGSTFHLRDAAVRLERITTGTAGKSAAVLSVRTATTTRTVTVQAGETVNIDGYDIKPVWVVPDR
jgi:hypothetical protein